MKDEDKTFENERKHMNEPVEDRGTVDPILDLAYLIEQHKKEIWKYKQKEADWLKTNNVLEGSKKIIDELSSKMLVLVRRVQELEYDNNTYKKEIEKLTGSK